MFAMNEEQIFVFSLKGLCYQASFDNCLEPLNKLTFVYPRLL